MFGLVPRVVDRCHLYFVSTKCFTVFFAIEWLVEDMKRIVTECMVRNMKEDIIMKEMLECTPTYDEHAKSTKIHLSYV